MESSLLNLVYNLSEEIMKLYWQDDKKCEDYGIKYKYYDCYLEYRNLRKMVQMFMLWQKIYQQNFHEKLKKQIFNTYKFSSHGNNKFIFLFWKDDYPYEYITDWEKFSVIWLPVKEDFYCYLNVEDNTDADNVHAKRFCKEFEIKNLGEYYDLYVQIDTLLLADVMRTFEMCVLKYTNLIPQNFFQLQD